MNVLVPPSPYAPLRLRTLVVFWILLSGCSWGCRGEAPPSDRDGLPGDTARAEESFDVPHADTTESRAWSPEGLVAQPRMAGLRHRMPDGAGYRPGTTPWRDAGIEIPEAAATAATPAALLDDLARALGWNDALGEDLWEQTRRIGQEVDGRAPAVVLQWGWKDDAVAGHDFRVDMRRDESGWYVERIEERFHCSRAVTAAGQCL